MLVLLCSAPLVCGDVQAFWEDAQPARDDSSSQQPRSRPQEQDLPDEAAEADMPQPADPAAGAEADVPPAGQLHALAASAGSMLLLSLDEPSAAYATLSNMLFKAVDVHPFVIVLDYHPVKVRTCRSMVQPALSSMQST